MNILAFNGSPRRRGNTSLLLHELLRGACEGGAEVEEVIAEEINIKSCRGCLRCNVLKRCAIRGDDWPALSSRILNADVLVFASPVYFHHLTSSLKRILDRFRSFINVQITEHGLSHTPWHIWSKKFILLLCMGSSDEADAVPVIELFKFMTSILGQNNKLVTLAGTRLAVTNQVIMREEELQSLYARLNLPSYLAKNDFLENQKLIRKCYDMGKNAGRMNCQFQE